MMMKMLKDTKSHSLSGISRQRVQPGVAESAKTSATPPSFRQTRVQRDLHGAAAETLYKAMQATKINAPSTDCLTPIGERAILAGLYKQIKGEFYTAVTRPPAVYRGNPFVIEAGLAFGKNPEQAAKVKEQNIPLAEGEDRDDDNELASVIRYANRVPLLYQQSAARLSNRSSTPVGVTTAWRSRAARCQPDRW